MIDCPYCKVENEVCHDDGAGYDESVIESQSCKLCRKEFHYSTYIMFHHTNTDSDGNDLEEDDNGNFITEESGNDG